MALSQKHEGKMLVPWFNSNEWKYVKELIFGDSSTTECKLQALDILRMWKIRTPKLPSGVEGTFIILDALMQDKETISAENLQTVYGSALMRFLNLCGASGDKQGTFYKIAKQNDLPDWLINLRHDVSHDQVMPSQYMLSLGLNFCFDWVKAAYWEMQSLTITDFISIAEKETNIDALKLYCHINLFCYLDTNNVADVNDIASLDTDLSYRISTFKVVANIDADMKIEEVLFLLLEHVRNGIKIDKESHGELIASALVNDGSFFAIEAVTKNDGTQEIPKDYLIIWQDLINLLYTEEILCPLIKNLLQHSSNEDANDHTRNMASLWLVELFKALLLAKHIHEKYIIIPNHENLHKQSVDAIKRIDILNKRPDLETCFTLCFTNCTGIINGIKGFYKEALDNPHEFTLTFLKYLLQLCDCPEEYINETISYVDSYTTTPTPDEMVGPDYTMHTCEEIEEMLPAPAPVIQNDFVADATDDETELPNAPKKPKFQLVKDRSIFAGCPLGVLPYQNGEVNPLLEQLYTTSTY